MAVLERLKQLGVPRAITERSKRFLDLLWANQHSTEIDVEHYLKLLSPVLSTEIKLALYLKKIKATPFFQSCGREVLIALVNAVNTRVFMAGDYIVRRGEFGDWMCFIARGSVSVLVPDPTKQVEKEGAAIATKEVAVLREGPGGFFGEMALIYRRARNATIQARSWLRIHQLFRVDFERTFRLYPEEKKKMDATIEKLKVFKTGKKPSKPTVTPTARQPPPRRARSASADTAKNAARRSARAGAAGSGSGAQWE